MPRLTISEVAQRARVSKMTVSRVVNHQPGVSPKLRTRVQKVIDQMGYVPSSLARSLSVGRTNLVGILVPDIISEWITPLVFGVGESAADLGYQVLLRTTGRGQTYSADAPDILMSSDLADGLIVATWRVPVAFAQKLARRGAAVVVIDGYARPDDVPWVSAADRSGAKQATGHLLSIGHRRIAFIGGGEEPYLAQQRLAGFLDALSGNGFNPEASLIVQGDFTRESGYARATEVLSRRPRPTAIFAANDPMAVGALDAALELGLSVPGDLSIVGFDDMPIAAHVNPGLTTVARPYGEMGATAVRLLVETLAEAPAKRRARQIDLPTRLVVRASTSPPRSSER